LEEERVMTYSEATCLTFRACFMLVAAMNPHSCVAFL
jgi:predicted ATPase with chaperone activity